MTDTERETWMNGTRRASNDVQSLVSAGAIRCDDCTDTALTIGHSGAGSAVRVHCRDHFMAHLNAERATRPSRDELLARVNRAVGR